MTITHYGQQFAAHFRAEAISQLETRGFKSAPLLVSRVRHDAPAHGLTRPVKAQPNFSVLLQLRTQQKRELFLGGKLVDCSPYPARTLSITNHLEEPQANLRSAFDTLIFTVPRAALEDIADEGDIPRIEHLRCERGLVDETMWHLGQALLPALERPHEVGSLFAEHIMLAINTYIARTFGGVPAKSSGAQGRLAPWQVRRATEMMMANLADTAGLAELAAQCGLSRSHFIRCFKQAMGEPPHRWLQRQRVEMARRLVRESGMSLADIALACGFADQSHFTRVFTSFTGTSPGALRRDMGG